MYSNRELFVQFNKFSPYLGNIYDKYVKFKYTFMLSISNIMFVVYIIMIKINHLGGLK